jgi:hypothetical protein
VGTDRNEGHEADTEESADERIEKKKRRVQKMGIRNAVKAVQEGAASGNGEIEGAKGGGGRIKVC